jgi:hypothetical protein
MNPRANQLMDIETEKVAAAVLTLPFITLHEGNRVEVGRLLRNESVA